MRESHETSGGYDKVTPRGTSRIPAISLPKGGGAMRGLGEKFASNPVTGTLMFTVPIFTSPGRSGFGPKLSLSYDSGAGNGPFGFGWSLSLPAITRRTDKGLPRYDDAESLDVFILSGAEDLVPEMIETGGRWHRLTLSRAMADTPYRIVRYRPRIEGLFARIERWTNPADPADTFWRSISRDNTTTWYGRTGNSRIADPENPSRIFSWLICETHDDKGNRIVYDYKAENPTGVVVSSAHEQNRTDTNRSANRYLKHIRYGNRTPYFPGPQSDATRLMPDEWLFEVVLDYGDHDPDRPTPDESLPWPVRLDPFSSRRSGFEVRTYRLCRRVLMFHRFGQPGEQPCLVRSTDFSYNSEDNSQDVHHPSYSFLYSAGQTGYRRREDGSYLGKALPPLEFSYSQPVIGGEVCEVDSESLENLPNGLDGNRYQWIDLDGEGIPGIFIEQGQGWYYKRNLGPVNGGDTPAARFSPLELIAARPSQAAYGGKSSRFMDLAGDGRLDMVTLDHPFAGFYERTQEKDWEAFAPFESRPVVDWGNPNLRFLDLTGDGHADILISEDEVFCWQLSLGEEGFGPAERLKKVLDEEKGPTLVFADRTDSIYLADMSGDGLSDLVRIRNGEVCYWPNLGYGRFGARVTMDNAPWFDAPDLFDKARIRLADIDGSGTTDIIYLSQPGVSIYFNRSGNSWSPVIRLNAFPTAGDLSLFQVVDLFGNGTACLVWSSALPGDVQHPMRYIDLMGGQKPHLLTKAINNLGAETHVQYAPSTRFYLADQQSGKPWITRIPFPVHVVERVETCDRISGNVFVTRYTYHHGYFDGMDREFRGFGMVEQTDTETFAAFSERQSFADATNIDEASHVPPVLTRTWFHTGPYIGRHRVSNYFAGLVDETDRGEYYRDPGITDEQAKLHLLDDTVLPDGLNTEEQRQACRALKGSMMRREVYALDGTEKEAHPYVVTEQNFSVRMLQPKADNPHAIFFTHARETVTYHYERNAEDPRIGHALTLQVDDFGNVLKSAEVGYGRRRPDEGLSPEDRKRQAEILMRYTEQVFTNPIDSEDSYRTPLSAETRTYELTGLALKEGQVRFSAEDLLDAAAAAPQLPFEAETSGIPGKRLIEDERSMYRPDDLGLSQNDPLTLLPLGRLESRALAGERYQLAMTPGLIEKTFGGRVTDSILEEEGRYVHGEGDRNWWVPSGRVFFSPGMNDPPEIELAYARDHFFLPHRFRDPFHSERFPTETVVSYDAYHLLLEQTRDALGNRVTVGERDGEGNLVKGGQDYRVLQPAMIMDPNRNRTAVAFDTLGRVVGTAVMGKPEEILGDSLDGFDADLDDTETIEHLTEPLADPQSILGNATSRLVYDLDAYHRTRNQPRPEPPVVYIMARETHASDLQDGQKARVQHRFSYSDGFGREIQQKIQAEKGPVPQRDAEGRIVTGPGGYPQMLENDTHPRWVGSGWTVFNNKGKPVRKYEPFFTDTHRFEFDTRIGVSPVLFYDPVERVVAALNPNHTWHKVVFDCWRQETWDVNDTLLVGNPAEDPDVGDFFRRLPDSDYLPTWYGSRIDGKPGPQEQAAAQKTELHANTPTVAFMDSLGRTFLSIAHNRFLRNDSTGSGETVEEKLQTRMIRDIVDNEREVIDAKGRTVVQYDYDLLRRRIRSESMDAGQRLMLNDILGQAIRTWDARGHEFRTEYDPLHRPVRRFLRGTDAALSDPRVVHREVLFQKTEYGEGQPNDIALNLRTRVFKQYDSAGVLASVGLNPVINAEEAYDFKGNLLRGTWQLTADYKGIADWAQPVALEAEVFSSSTAYDALNRPVSLVAPDNSEIRSTYSEANLLEQVKARIRGAVQWVTCVENIDYNAKGQRSLIEYGNGVQTRYEYDPIMFRLAQMKTTRGPGEDLQHLSYTYDPTGNVTHIQDAAQQTIFFANTRITPDSDYRYDAVYQLIEATGREHIGQAGQVDHGDPQIYPLPHPNSGEAMQRYTERYAYDAAGNIVSMIHQANGGSWTRRYRYGSDNNHLLAISLPGDDPTGPYAGRYAHNAHGSMTVMPHLPLVVWDFAERMQSSSRQVVAGGTPETTYYVYDASGRRVRKVTERQAAQGQTPTRMREHIYLGGFEMFREYGGDGIRIALEKETLHVMDNDHRIALSETKTVDSGSPLTSHVSLLRYQISDHLSSARLELDQTGQVISFEEYHPYGTTSFRATDSTVEVSPKRYRYTGKEKDEETGLYYHGARYYACWLGRWCSADPSGIVDGVGLYAYGRNTPVMRKDSTGRQSETWGQYIKGWIDWALSRSEPTPQQGPSLSSFGDPYRRVPGEEPTPYGFSTIPQEQRPVRELTPDQEAAHLESLRNQPAGINEMTAPARAGDPQDSPARRADSQAMRSGEVGSRPFDATPPGPEQPAAQAPRPQSDFPGRRPIESVNPAGRLPGVENEWIEAAESPEGSWRRTAPERTVLPESASPTPSPAKGIKLRSVDPSMLLELWVAGSDYVFAEDLARRDQILRKATRDQITPEDLSFMNERFGGYPVYDDNGFVTAWKYDLTSFTGFAEWIKEAVRAFGALTDQTPRVYPETA